MAADPMQGPAGLTSQPLAPPEDPAGVEGQMPPPEAQGEMEMDPQALMADAEAANEHDDVAEEVTQAIYAGCVLVKAYAEGQPEQINVANYKDAAQGVQALLLGLAAIKPPTPPVDPNLAQKDATDSAKAVLQDEQHRESTEAQLELGKRREGRPSGPAKP